MRVAVLCGGRSSEHDVSLRSGEAVARGLEEAGHEALLVTIARDGGWSFRGAPVELMPAAGLFGADAAFPALHGPFGEDGSVQGVLEWLDLPYVGSDVLASAVCMDKLTLKRLFAQARPAAGRVRRRRRGGLARALRGDGAAALGQALAARLQRRHQQGRGARGGARRGGRPGPAPRPAGDRRGLAPRPRGRVLAARQRAVEASLPGEVVAHGDWYDYETKYSDGGMELIVPAPIPDERPTVRLRELAVEAFRARRLRRPRPLRLLRRARRRGARQRDQHDARLHRDQRLRQALGGQRPRLPGPMRPPGRARDRAPRRARSHEF